MNCPYCNEPSDQLDSIVKLPNGDRVHFKCSDKMLVEWTELKAENKKLWGYKEQAEIYALMLQTSFTEQEIEDAYEKVIEVYRKCDAKEVSDD